MKPYEFKPDDAFGFAEYVGHKAYAKGKELIFEKCPYCKQSTSDKKTFAISLVNGAFNCKRASCDAKGNMLTLHRDFGFSLGRDADEYYDKPVKKYRNIHKDADKIMIKDPAIKYMAGRGIGERITRTYHITTRKDDDSILVFPFYDENKILRFIKYRDANFTPEKKEAGHNKEWCERNCLTILFGMDQCDANVNDTLVLTEGQIDSLSCSEAGIANAVSVPTGAMGFTWFPHCYDFLQHFNTLIVFGDHEHGHITLLDEMCRRFHGTVKHVREEDYRGCKDANEILQKYGKEAVKHAVENAVLVPVMHVQEMADIEDPDEDAYLSFSSGFPTIDEVAGGLQLGQLIVLTGQTGLGKSTFGEQLVTFAVKEGYPTLVYSGELRNYKVRQAIDRQIAGPDYIGEKRNIHVSNYTEPMVYKSRAKTIHEWYRGKLYLYDNTSTYRKENDEEHAEALYDTFQKAIIQNGVQVILVDNLMTAMDDEVNIDQYRQQTIFIKKMKSLVMTYNVLIILVAHPRKSNAENITNEEVSGSANITNLADLVVSFSKLTDEEGGKYGQNGCNRKIKITKNRTTGKLVNLIPVYYESNSGRIVEMAKKGNNYDPTVLPKYTGPQFNYGWLQEEFTEADDEMTNIPFDIEGDENEEKEA